MNKDSVEKEFELAFNNLAACHDAFRLGGASSLEHSRLRERAISACLTAMASELGCELTGFNHYTSIESHLYIDPYGEFSLLAKNGFGAEFSSRLNESKGARCGIFVTEHLESTATWCRLNHFAAEKMIRWHALSISGYSLDQIANDLDEIASGSSYDDRALKAAQMIPFLSDDQRSAISAVKDGYEDKSGAIYRELQHIAIDIREFILKNGKQEDQPCHSLKFK